MAMVRFGRFKDQLIKENNMFKKLRKKIFLWAINVVLDEKEYGLQDITDALRYKDRHLLQNFGVYLWPDTYDVYREYKEANKWRLRKQRETSRKEI